MTKEEALTEWVMPAIRKTWNEKKCDEILKALAQEPCGKDINVPATDAISREAVEDAIIWNDEKREMLDEIQKLPSVQPKQKTGHWISDGRNKICYECNFKIDTWHDTAIAGMKLNYCPNCGEKMVEPQESEVNNG